MLAQTFILPVASARWPAMKKWNIEYLASAFHGKDVIAGMEGADTIVFLENLDL